MCRTCGNNLAVAKDVRIADVHVGRRDIRIERNALISDSFLPSPENFATLGVLPGVALKAWFGEVGASVAGTHPAYLEDYDYLGLRRGQDRLQPNLFWTSTFAGVGFEGSVSSFAARFRGDDLDPVHALLYTGRLKIPIRDVTSAT